MANATQKEYVVKEVTLEMTEVEANFLADLLRLVSGNRDASRRRHADAMIEAMRVLGIVGYGPHDIATDYDVRFLSPDA
jgi:hypothetical protein